MMLKDWTDTAAANTTLHIFHDSAKLSTEARAGERILLQRLAQGDSAAFWNFWELYHRDLYRCCLHWMNGNHADAEDALSAARIKIWNYLQQNPPEIANIKAWVMQVIHHLCIDLQRQRRRHVTLSLENSLVDEEERATRAVDHCDAAILNREISESIHQAISELPWRLREPCVLRFCRDMSYAAIAQGLNLTEESIRKRIQRARVILQQQLRDQV
ncbi:MAG: RNA polymerase sigma factor [Armatimonadota bacterium]|nr:RNA polymerase sigma factor [Armatimonadota bacterium]